MKIQIFILGLVAIAFASAEEGVFQEIGITGIGTGGGTGTPTDFTQSLSFYVALGVGINILINILRYMISYATGDEGLKAKTLASVLNSVAVALLIGSTFMLISFAEGVITQAFYGNASGGYAVFLDNFHTEFQDLVNQVQMKVIVPKINQLRQLYSAQKTTHSFFGVPVIAGGCVLGDEDCQARKQQRAAELQAAIEVGYDVTIGITVADTAFNFFNGTGYNAAGFLLIIGLAYYALDVSRPAGAAMIALGMGAYYVYPVAYKAFIDLPKFPEFAGGETVIDIQSSDFCAISTVPSAYLTNSDANLELAQATSPAAATFASLQTSSLIAFLNDLYLNFLLKHGVAATITLLFIQHSYIVLTGGMVAGPLISGLGRYL